MTRRSEAIERCEKELYRRGIDRNPIGTLDENEARALECFDKLMKSLTVSEIYELECLLYYLRMAIWGEDRGEA